MILIPSAFWPLKGNNRLSSSYINPSCKSFFGILGILSVVVD